MRHTPNFALTSGREHGMKKKKGFLKDIFEDPMFQDSDQSKVGIEGREKTPTICQLPVMDALGQREARRPTMLFQRRGSQLHEHELGPNRSITPRKSTHFETPTSGDTDNFSRHPLGHLSISESTFGCYSWGRVQECDWLLIDRGQKYC